MEQRRLGLIAKAMLVVPGHCLAQAAREFLALYPNARILVADETNFSKDKRARFLSRAATATWDATERSGALESGSRLLAAPFGGAPSLGGRADRTNPEELLLGAVVTCFVQTWAIFLAKLRVGV